MSIQLDTTSSLLRVSIKFSFEGISIKNVCNIYLLHTFFLIYLEVLVLLSPGEFFGESTVLNNPSDLVEKISYDCFYRTGFHAENFKQQT